MYLLHGQACGHLASDVGATVDVLLAVQVS